MSLISKKSLIRTLRRGKQARSRMIEANLSEGIAYQIRATRDAREMTQSKLAREVEMTQNNVSRLEDPEYGKHTISSLKRLADALDVALIVRFVPFSQYIDWLSGTPHLDNGIRPEALAVPSFEDEEKDGKYEAQIVYYPVHITQHVPVVGGPSTGLVIAYAPQQQLSSLTGMHGFYQSQIQSQVPVPVRIFVSEEKVA
jgi:transcriptional regulator with XRE-family HTH domain